jgi:hypothetical protein
MAKAIRKLEAGSWKLEATSYKLEPTAAMVKYSDKAVKGKS